MHVKFRFSRKDDHINYSCSATSLYCNFRLIFFYLQKTAPQTRIVKSGLDIFVLLLSLISIIFVLLEEHYLLFGVLACNVLMYLFYRINMPDHPACT